MLLKHNVYFIIDKSTLIFWYTMKNLPNSNFGAARFVPVKIPSLLKP